MTQRDTGTADAIDRPRLPHAQPTQIGLWQAVAGALASGIVLGSPIGGVTAITRGLDTD